MKLTKYNHSCVVIEDGGQKVVIDPGSFLPGLPDVSNAVALIITHEHPDHFNIENVKQIVAANPDIEVYAADGIASQLEDLDVTTALPGETLSAGSFRLKFFGGLHALVHKTMPRPANIGVLINDTVYYPGDSYDAPDVRPKVLLTPTSGPWLKIGDVIDFLDVVKPEIAIPTHNALQSELGESLAEQWLRGVCNKHNISLRRLPPNESIEF